MSTTIEPTKQHASCTAPYSDDDFEILTIYPRESAPLEIGCLIRSKEDALNLHKVIRGHVEVTRGVGDAECNELGELIRNRWDSADFCRSDAEKITDLARKLHSLYLQEVTPHDDFDFGEDGPEFGVVESILWAISFAAKALVA